MREIDFREWVNAKEDKVTFGVELEFLLFNLQTKDLLENLDLTESVLSKLPKQIYRDYYPWQLEIRTTPTSDIKKCLSESLELYKIASQAFLDHKVMVIPMPSLTSNADVFCGLHLHLGFPAFKRIEDFWRKAMGIYPFALSIADHCKNSEIDDLHNSRRFVHSRHIGVPYLKKKEFISLDRPPEDRKYKDVILSPPVDSKKNRQRLEKPFTIEFRLFDTPSLFAMYKFIIESMVMLARRIRLDNPMVLGIENNYDDIRRKIFLTRNLIGGQRYGVNKIFRLYNGNVCEAIAEFFGIDYPEETQFEFRERQHLSNDINGFISMAIQGGWL